MRSWNASGEGSTMCSISKNVILAQIQEFQFVHISAQDSAAMYATFCNAESNFL